MFASRILGFLKPVYEADRLRYVLEEEALDLEPADPVPVRVGDRTILGTRGALLVFEDGVEVARQSTASKDCIAAVAVKADGRSVRTGCEFTRGTGVLGPRNRPRRLRWDAR